MRVFKESGNLWNESMYSSPSNGKIEVQNSFFNIEEATKKGEGKFPKFKPALLLMNIVFVSSCKHGGGFGKYVLIQHVH